MKDQSVSFNHDATLELNERSELIKPEKPILKARVPTLFGLATAALEEHGQTRNFIQATRKSPRSYSLNVTAQKNMQNNQDINNSMMNEKQNSSSIQDMIVDSFIVDLKKRELSTIKKANELNT